MSPYNCGYCMFAEETEHGSSDLIYCWILHQMRQINDYPCSRFKSNKEIGGELR